MPFKFYNLKFSYAVRKTRRMKKETVFFYGVFRTFSRAFIVNVVMGNPKPIVKLKSNAAPRAYATITNLDR